jgi:lysozyme
MRRALLALAVIGILLVPAGVVSAATTVPGIDVSQWQETIDWEAVAGTTTRFAILRAVKGHDDVDPTYATNLAGATAAGVVVGAYHRATPSATPGDAKAEANHFLDVARNAAGDLIPALDIEETGGLPPAELTDWVRTWVVRVRNVLGVRPMLYASPYFWRANMGDTRWFANHGYPLWIANWNVAAPDVPADGWGGHGWTFWQWTATGHVNGIATDVDRDRFAGLDLTAARIASLAVTPAAGGVVTGEKIACGAGQTRCDRLASPGDPLVLTATPDPDAVFLGWAGACAGEPSATCTVTALGNQATAAVFGYPLRVSTTGSGGGAVVSSPDGIDCPATGCEAPFVAGADVTLTADADAASTFVSWGGACTGIATTCVVPVDGPTDVTARFDTTVTLGEDGPGAAFDWGRTRSPIAVGGAYRWEEDAGAEISFAFRGPSVTLSTLEGPAMGRARVSVDGAPLVTVDGYARSLRGAERRFAGLGGGDHVLVVTALGTARPVAAGSVVAVDAIRAGGELRANPRPLSARWSPRTHPDATDGTAVSSRAAGAEVTLTFTGTGVSLRTAVGPTMGRADLWIDGSFVRTVSLRAPAVAYGATRTVRGLVDGEHVLVVVVREGRVVVDGWIVR